MSKNFSRRDFLKVPWFQPVLWAWLPAAPRRPKLPPPQ